MSEEQGQMDQPGPIDINQLAWLHNKHLSKALHLVVTKSPGGRWAAVAGDFYGDSGYHHRFDGFVTLRDLAKTYAKLDTLLSDLQRACGYLPAVKLTVEGNK